MSKLEAYYEAPYDDQDSEEFEFEVTELMKTEFSPDTFTNFEQAIAYAKASDVEAVEAILSQPEVDFKALGRKLYCMAYDYQEFYAKRKVREGY